MDQERSKDSQKRPDELTQEDNAAERWFTIACDKAAQGKQNEAEVAIRKSLNIRDDYPIAWAILSAILLAEGRETDAEKAGKKAISQCKGLKMTWPKMRSIIFYKGIVKGSSWKDPRKVVIESITSNEWGTLLSALGKASKQNLDDVITVVEETPTEEVRTPITTPKSYGTTGKIYEMRAETESKELESYIDYTPEKQESTSRTREPRKIRPLVDDAIKQPVIAEKSQQPSDASIWFTAAESQIEQGDLKDAEVAYLKGLDIDPSRGEAWLSLSSLRMGNHQYDEAVVALERAVDLMPASSAAWYQLGYCLQKLNKWKDAIQPLRNAIKIDQNNAEFWMALGLSEFHLNQIEASARSLLRVLRIAPNHKDALFHLAMCMERQGNRQHAISLYLKLLNLGGLTHTMLKRMESAFTRLGRPHEAREARRQAEIARQAIRH
ncbi:tetratricopeptide repeat protein [Candidatus Thorarchaeota archaeon]|nr:MAG: tetratricopeptide repeat protein [Candidatus Thorarchaeota archaeon]